MVKSVATKKSAARHTAAESHMSRPAFSLSALGRVNSFVTGKNAIKNKHTCLTQSGLTAELFIKPISF